MKLILIILTALFFAGCAEKEGPYVRCAVYIKGSNPDGTRMNGFWDVDRNQDVLVQQCDEILPVR